MERSRFETLIQRYRCDEETSSILKDMRWTEESEEITVTGLFFTLVLGADHLTDEQFAHAWYGVIDGSIEVPEDLPDVLERAHAIAIERIRRYFPIRIEQITVNDLWEALGFPQFKTPLAHAA